MSSNKSKQVLKYASIALVVIVIGALAINFTVFNRPSKSEYKPSINVIDLAGRNVTVPTNVQKIVTSQPDTLRQIGLFGEEAVNKVVGITSYVDKTTITDTEVQLEDAWAYPQLLNASRVGISGDLDTEMLIALDPDVIFFSSTFVTSADPIQAQTNVSVVCVSSWGNPTNNATLEDFYKGIRLVGQILGMDARAEEIIAYYQGEIDFVQSRVSTLSPSEQQTVYLANWANHLGTTWTTCKYWPIESAGGINVAEGMTPTYGEVTEEQILEWNPDVIFIHGMKGKSAAEDITSSALLQGTDAVKNGRVYGLFGPYIGSDPKLWLADMYITAKALYPDLFSDISITAKGEEIFVFCYGAGMGPLFERSITDRGAYISPELTP